MALTNWSPDSNPTCTLNSASHHHHQNTKCGNIWWKNETILPDECQRRGKLTLKLFCLHMVDQRCMLSLIAILIKVIKIVLHSNFLSFLIFGLMYSTFTGFLPLCEFNFLFYKTTIAESVSPNICSAWLSFRDWNPKQKHTKQMWHTYRIRENVAEWDMLTVLVSDVKVTNKSLM